MTIPNGPPNNSCLGLNFEHCKSMLIDLFSILEIYGRDTWFYPFLFGFISKTESIEGGDSFLTFTFDFNESN